MEQSMEQPKLSKEAIAKETFKLLLNITTLKSDCFGSQFEERSKFFKMNQKKYYLLFCMDMKKNCTLTDIEKMLVENRSTASIAVSKLYREGLVNKCKPEKEDDGRKVYFKVTKKGKAILNGFHELFMQSVSGFYNDLSDENKLNFINGIQSLNKIFEGISSINIAN